MKAVCSGITPQVVHPFCCNQDVLAVAAVKGISPAATADPVVACASK